MSLPIPRRVMFTLLVVALAQSACHLAFPFNAFTENDGAVDAPVDTASDLPWDLSRDARPEVSVDTAADTAPPPDAPKPPDQSSPPEAALPPDTAQPLDMSPPPDATWPPDTMCGTKSINQYAKQCAGQSLSAVNDTDMDGMLDKRDPSSKCNQLLLAEDFRTPPDPSRWTTKGATPACGRLNLQAGGNVVLAKPSLLTAGGPYLLEVKFAFDTVSVATDWRVGVANGLSSGVRYQCEVWISATYNVPSPSIHHNRNNTCGTGGYWPKQSTISGAVGTSYILQSYHDGIRDSCRIVDATGKVVAQGTVGFSGCPTNTPDTFRIYTSGRAVSLDWVHVFRM